MNALWPHFARVETAQQNALLARAAATHEAG